MNIRKVIFNIVSILLLTSLVAYAQQYTAPLNIPPALSGNFGELRNNHFHSGVDYKTQQIENKTVIAIEDGYVSRVNVSPGGYGLALYIDHPTGHTSVYGHLNSFSPKIADYVRQKQYEQESYRVELYPEAGLLRVKKGEQIALSGNTGSSGGAHLHFEVRDTKTQDPIDPLKFFSRTITDTQKPDIRGIAFYPVDGKGVVNGNANALRLSVRKNKSGVPLDLNQTVNAWGKIGVGVKAYDRMNGQSNIYGVKHVRLFVDEKPVFGSSIDRFSFSKTRMMNSFIDFEDWRKQNSFFMKSFVEPGNTLDFYNTVNGGYIDINEERDYRMRYELEDYHGNTLTYSFVVKGQRQPIVQAKKCDNFMSWGLPNSFVDFDFMLNIPVGNLYDSFCYTHRRTSSSVFHSAIYQVNNAPIPLHDNAALWIKLNADTIVDKKRYGIVEVKERGNNSWLGGTYKNGGMETSIRELGRTYAVDIDTMAPKITPVNPDKWVSARKIQLRLMDDKSGVADFRGTIDGKFVLFSHDMKSSVYTYIFDDTRLERNKKSALVFTVWDRVGNSAEYRYDISL